jgi:hypothetical protein
MSDYSTSAQVCAQPHIAPLAEVLKLIKKPVQRVEQIDLWVEFGLITTGEAAHLVQARFVFNHGGDE